MTRTRGAVAAVVPVRNEITTLPVLVEALLNQTEPIDELVIVDGGSVDGTTEMAMELADGDPRISVVVAGPASPGRGRNLGIEATSAPWILLVDAGISVDGSLVEMLMARRDADPQCRMVLGSRRIQADPRWRAAAIITGIRERECVEGQWGRFDLIPSLLDRQLWTDIGGFRDWRAGEDLDFMERLALSPPRILKAPLAEAVWDLAVDRRRVFQKWRTYEYHNAVHGNSWHRPVFLWNSLGGALAATATVVIGLPGLLFLLGPHVLRSAVRYRRHCWRGDDEVAGGPWVFLQAVAASVFVDVATFLGYVDFRLGRLSQEF